MAEGAHTQISMQGDGGTSGEGGGGDFLSSVPEAYREKPYMKDIDSQDKLFQQFDNVQSLIGKKTVGIPTAESSEEDWGKFYNQMGRPEEASKYEFDKADIPEGLELNLDGDEGLKEAKEMFHKAGLTDKQAKMIKSAYDKKFIEQYGKVMDQQKVQLETMNNEFEGLLDTHFGDQKSAASARVNKLLSEHTPDAFKNHVQSLDNKNLMLLTAVLDNVHKKYIAEEAVPPGGPAVPAQTIESMKEKAQGLMKSDAWKNPMDMQHDSTKKQVKELYEQMEQAKVNAKAKK